MSEVDLQLLEFEPAVQVFQVITEVIFGEMHKLHIIMLET